MFGKAKELFRSAVENVKTTAENFRTVGSKQLRENRAEISGQVPDLTKAPSPKQGMSAWEKMKNWKSPKVSEQEPIQEPKEKTITLELLNLKILELTSQSAELDSSLMSANSADKMPIYRQIFDLNNKISNLNNLKLSHTKKEALAMDSFKKSNPNETYNQDDPSLVTFELPLDLISRTEYDYIKKTLEQNPKAKFSDDLEKKYTNYKLAIYKSIKENEVKSHSPVMEGSTFDGEGDTNEKSPAVKQSYTVQAAEKAIADKKSNADKKPELPRSLRSQGSGIIAARSVK